MSEWTGANDNRYQWEDDPNADDIGALVCEVDDGLLEVYPGAWSLSGAGRYWYWHIELGYMGGSTPESPPEWVVRYDQADDTGGNTLAGAKFSAQRAYERWLVREQCDIEDEWAEIEAAEIAQLAWEKEQATWA